MASVIQFSTTQRVNGSDVRRSRGAGPAVTSRREATDCGGVARLRAVSLALTGTVTSGSEITAPACDVGFAEKSSSARGACSLVQAKIAAVSATTCQGTVRTRKALLGINQARETIIRPADFASQPGG